MSRLLTHKNYSLIAIIALATIAWRSSHAAPQLPQRLQFQLHEPKSLNEQLEQAAWTGSFEDVKQLLDAGAEANATVRGGLSTPLLRASHEGRIDVMKLLIKRGADVNVLATDGRTPLIEAAMHHSTDGLKLLLEAGAKPTGAELASACFRKQSTTEKMQLLLDAGAPASAGMYTAATIGDLDLLKLLLRHGAKINGKDTQGNAALHGAAQGGTEVTRFLLDQKADPNLKGHGGNTPLHQAVLGGGIPIVQLLLDAQADPTRRNDELVSPTRLANMQYRKPVYELLVKATGGQERFEPVDPKYRNGKSVAQLIKIATSKAATPDDFKERSAACLGLISYGEDSADAIATALRKKPDNNSRLYDVLMKLGPQAEAAFPMLEKMLTNDESVITAIAILPRMIPGYLDQLPESTKNRADQLLLSKILNAKTEEEMISHFFATRLSDASAIKLLDSGEPLTRQLAGQIAAERPDTELSKRVTKYQLRVAKDESANPIERQQALFRLATKKKVEAEVVETFWQILRNAPRPLPNRQLQRITSMAGNGLGRTLTKEQIGDLLPMLTPIDNHLRPGAIAALESLKPELIPDLIVLLEHNDAAIAFSAVAALKSRPRGTVTQPLLAALDDADDRGKAFVVQALGQIRSPEVKNKLLEIAVDPSNDTSIRAEAATGLLRMHRTLAPEEKQLLIAELPDCANCIENESSLVRVRFVGNLQLLGADAASALPVLRKYMKENPLPKYKDDPKRWHELHPFAQALSQIEVSIAEESGQ